MLRVTVAIIVVALALSLEALAAAYLSPGYTIGLSLLVPLAAFAAVAWAFAPSPQPFVKPLAGGLAGRRRNVSDRRASSPPRRVC